MLAGGLCFAGLQRFARSGLGAALQAVRRQGDDLTAWLEYAAEGLHHTLERVWRRIQAIPSAGRAQLVLRPRQEELLQLLRTHGSLSPKELWDGLGISKQGAIGLLRPLMKGGLVKRVGTLKNGRYVLK